LTVLEDALSSKGAAVFGFIRMSSIVLGRCLALGGLNACGFWRTDDTLRRIPGYPLIVSNPLIAVGLGVVIILIAFVVPSDARAARLDVISPVVGVQSRLSSGP
jgi:hypothetical protein